MKHKYSKNELENAVKESKSIASVCRCLNIRPVGGNYKTIKEKIKKYDIDNSHFTGQGWNVGLKFKPSKKRPLSEILVKNSDFSSTTKLKHRLFNEGVKEKKCEKCKLSEWLGLPIPLELDHINGINTDHRIENLRILCPNCHAQTPTYRRRNNLSALSEKRGVEFLKFRETLTDNADGNLEPSHYKKTMKGAETKQGKSKSKKTKKCLVCETLISNSRKFCSVECYRSSVNKTIPKVPELLETFNTEKTFTGVGKKYGVSDNAVKKWCKNYGILDMIKR
ncbi:MAG: HNH endonuclease signature motif containing protein [Bacteroidales bacterium]|jgi:hypothetical protein|nr:HNH endonuclease signature motif containing protein [Bacteroidales bacterium]